MAAYALVELTVRDWDQMGPYIEKVPETIAAHGGKFLVRAGETEVVEGSIGEFPLKVVIEFPTMAATKASYNSPEYQAILPGRLENSTANFVFVKGV